MTSPRPPEVVLEEITSACRALNERGADLFRWEWDSYFAAALSVTQDPQHHEVLALLQQAFAGIWDATSIAGAPPRIVALSAACKGLRSGQKLLTGHDTDDPLLYGLWWPWGSGKQFSLRIGCLAESAAAKALDPLSGVLSALGIAR